MQKQRVLPKNNIGSHSKIEILKKVKKTSSSDIHVKKIVIETNVDRCFPPDKSGISYKEELKRLFKKKKPVNELFNGVQFNLVNPTNQPCSFNLFDGWSITPVPNTPTGYVPILNPLGIPQMNFPASSGSGYPSYECAIASAPFAPAGAMNFATVYVPTTDRVYVVDDRFLNIYDPNTNLLVNTVALPNVNQGGGMAVFNSTNNRVYITPTIGNVIDIIDCATETVFGTFPCSSGSTPQGMAFNPANNTMYISMGADGNFEILDCATNTTGGLIVLAPASNLTGVTIWVNGANTYAFFVDSVFNDFYLVNAATNTLISAHNYLTPASYSGNAICYNATKNSVYFVNLTGSSIIEFSLGSSTFATAVASNFPVSLLCIPSYNVVYFDD